ncbi:MAG: FAD-binding and (Fe-S)-binding domain-containing protein [Planctomycetota bacterium]|jgi:FAD/FMN-containing dehydrogenase/Fe-S oxidoreductase
MADVPLEVILPRRPAAGDDHARDRIARELAALIEGEVRFGRHDRLLYATDASIYQVEPIGVVIPRSVDDAERVVRFCASRDLPLLPRGGGTSLAGQAVGPAVVLDFSPHCRGVLSLKAGEKTATVEPGVVLDELNRAAARHGLMFGPDVATSTHATLGGMIGNNSAGAHSILYGRTVEHLDAVDLLMADGSRVTLDRGASNRNPLAASLAQRVAEVVVPLASEIRNRYPKTVRRVNGYNLDLILDQIERSGSGRFDQVNLAHLICGAEGTLGVVVDARLRLVKTPRRRGLAIAALAGLDEALAAVPAIRATGPAAVELIDNVIIDLARHNVETRRYAELLPSREKAAPGAVLYVEYFADDDEAVDDRFSRLASRLGPVAINYYTDPVAMDRAWQLRRASEPLLHGVPGARKPLTFIEDTAVDPDRLADFVKAFRAIVASHGTTAAYYAHASVGCLHIRPLICLRDAGDQEAMGAIAAEVTDLVKTFGGALSGEHGDGRARSHLLERFYGRAICEGFAAIKAIFDPSNRMNPGNIVDPAPMTASWRVRPLQTPVTVPNVQTFYRYDRERGFGSAIEMCNGAGVCRKRAGSTMCPSYRALLDERHATRGRGNALRLAITGQLSADGRTPAWDDRETMQTLDLCLSCKACKAECPSNVDLAKLKAEYTAQRYAITGRIPLRARIFGRARPLYRVGSALGPLINRANRFGPTAAVVKRMLGVDRRRSLPSFGPSLYRGREARRDRAVGSGAPTVILLPDCFAVYGEPHIGRAAFRVLEAFGYRVALPRLGCCGRPPISTGMLAEASRVCHKTASALMRAVERHQAVAVVGCEPSCISAVKDDWLELDMGLEPESLEALADKTFLVEQFLEARWDRHRKRPPIGPGPHEEPVFLHGHCHQKALWGVESSQDLLTRLLGARLVVIDSGCCGMAGSFGYTPKHYELSLAIGELALFGAIRAEPHATIVAPGTSCRHQILDGTGRRALHPIELVASMVGEGTEGLRERGAEAQEERHEGTK